MTVELRNQTEHGYVMTVTFTFFLYLVFIGFISWWAYRKTKLQEDYFLGGRQLSASTAALSAGASDMSGWLLLGLPGYAFASGLESVWLSGGLCLGLAFCWFLMAKRLRIYTEYLDNALTIPAYLERRFDENTPTLRVLTAVVILFFFLFYVSSGFVAGAKLFSHIFSTSYFLGAVFTCLFVVIYTLIGGFLAVSWTDVLQGLLMLLALLIAPVMIIVANDGAGASLAFIETHNRELLNPLTNASGEPLGWIAIISLMGWGLGYFGQPHILARFKALKSGSEAPKAASIAVAWSILVNVGAIAVGLLAVLMFSNNDLVLGDSEQVFIVLADTLFHPVIAGVLLAAILAAIMSTADSQLLVCSSALAEDLLRPWQHRTDPVFLGRMGVFAMGLLALWIAADPQSNVLDIVSYAWAGLGAAFGPLILMSLFWQGVSRVAAIAGILVGGITVVVWKQLDGGLFAIYELVPGFLLSSIAVFLVSQVFKADQRVIAQHRLFIQKYHEA